MAQLAQLALADRADTPERPDLLALSEQPVRAARPEPLVPLVCLVPPVRQAPRAIPDLRDRLAQPAFRMYLAQLGPSVPLDRKVFREPPALPVPLAPQGPLA